MVIYSMPQGDGSYNRQHDAAMRRQQEARQRQEFLDSLTEEQRQAIREENRRQVEEGRRAARIWAETTLNRRNRANVVSDEDDIMHVNQNQQPGGRRIRKKQSKRRTKNATKNRKSKKSKSHGKKEHIENNKCIKYLIPKE